MSELVALDMWDGDEQVRMSPREIIEEVLDDFFIDVNTHFISKKIEEALVQYMGVLQKPEDATKMCMAPTFDDRLDWEPHSSPEEA